MSPDLVTAIVATVLTVGGVAAALLLRGAWKSQTTNRPWLIAAGWTVIALLAALPGLVLGGARGAFAASVAISVAALIVVARNMQLRQSKARGDKSLAPEPSDRPSKAWRGWLRGLMAGPLGMIAAMGVAICWAVVMPGEPQTRLVTGGLMVPVLWGGAMAWTLADDRLLRALAVLVGVTVVTFTTAVLKGFA